MKNIKIRWEGEIFLLFILQPMAGISLWRWSCNFFFHFIFYFFWWTAKEEKKWYRGLIQSSKNIFVLYCCLFFLWASERNEKWILYECYMGLCARLLEKFSRMNEMASRYIRQMIHFSLLHWSYLNNFKNYFSMMMFVREAHKYCAVMMNNRLLEIFTLRRKKN